MASFAHKRTEDIAFYNPAKKKQPKTDEILNVKSKAIAQDRLVSKKGTGVKDKKEI